MAAPGVPNAVALARVAQDPQAFEQLVAERMRQVGVPEQFIGMKGVPGVGEGALARYPGPQGGGNVRPDHPNALSGRWQPGINVDEAVFDPTFQALALDVAVSEAAVATYHEAWARATDQTRVDAVIAHEYAELTATATPELLEAFGIRWPHYAAILTAPDSPLTVSDEARELLRLHRGALGLE